MSKYLVVVTDGQHKTYQYVEAPTPEEAQKKALDDAAAGKAEKNLVQHRHGVGLWVDRCIKQAPICHECQKPMALIDTFGYGCASCIAKSGGSL